MLLYPVKLKLLATSLSRNSLNPLSDPELLQKFSKMSSIDQLVVLLHFCGLEEDNFYSDESSLNGHLNVFMRGHGKEMVLIYL